MIAAMIIAKGNSTRIPHKNSRQFCGKPLLAWTLIQAKYSQIDEIYVSTDSEEIARITENYGARVHWREHEAESFPDMSGGPPSYFLKKWIYENRPNVEIMVCMMCTSPLRRPGDIDAGIDVCKREQIQTELASKRYDTFIYNFTAPKRMVRFLAEKNYSFGDPLAGLTIYPGKLDLTALRMTDPSYIGEEWKSVSSDDTLNKTIFSGFNSLDAAGRLAVFAYAECEPWQIVEIDYAWQFELAEYYMKKYILKDGEDVYERYWKERQRCQTK
jgi:CMP-N-acetylneuraminic acid synthetase